MTMKQYFVYFMAGKWKTWLIEEANPGWQDLSDSLTDPTGPPPARG